MATITDSQLKIVVKEAVHEAMLGFGFNADNHEDVLELQKDRHYVRAQRLRSEASVNKALSHVINMALSAAAALLVLGAVRMFTGHS